MGLKRRNKVIKKGKSGKVRQGYSQTGTIFSNEGISPIIDVAHAGSRAFLVSGQTTTTDTPAESTENTGVMERSKRGTSEQLMLMPYQNTTSSVRDFLARVSQLLGSGEFQRIVLGALGGY